METPVDNTPDPPPVQPPGKTDSSKVESEKNPFNFLSGFTPSDPANTTKKTYSNTSHNGDPTDDFDDFLTNIDSLDAEDENIRYFVEIQSGPGTLSMEIRSQGYRLLPCGPVDSVVYQLNIHDPRVQNYLIRNSRKIGLLHAAPECAPGGNFAKIAIGKERTEEGKGKLRDYAIDKIEAEVSWLFRVLLPTVMEAGGEISIENTRNNLLFETPSFRYLMQQFDFLQRLDYTNCAFGSHTHAAPEEHPHQKWSTWVTSLNATETTPFTSRSVCNRPGSKFHTKIVGTDEFGRSNVRLAGAYPLGLSKCWAEIFAPHLSRQDWFKNAHSERELVNIATASTVDGARSSGLNIIDSATDAMVASAGRQGHYRILNTEDRFCLVRGFNGSTERLPYGVAATVAWTKEGVKILLVAYDVLISESPAHRSVICPFQLAENGWERSLDLSSSSISKGGHTLSYSRHGKNVGIITSVPSTSDIRELPHVPLVSGRYDKTKALQKYSGSEAASELANIRQVATDKGEGSILNCDFTHENVLSIATMTDKDMASFDMDDDLDMSTTTSNAAVNKVDTSRNVNGSTSLPPNHSDDPPPPAPGEHPPPQNHADVPPPSAPGEHSSPKVLQNQQHALTQARLIDPAIFCFPSADVLKHIPTATTHLGVRSGRNPLQRSYPSSHGMTNRLQENAGGDTCNFSTVTSYEGWNCAQLFALVGRTGSQTKNQRVREASGYIWLKGMRNKSAQSVVHSGRRFIAAIGVPADCFRLDGSQEQNGIKWNKMLDEYFIGDNENSEAGNSRQSIAETYIGVIKDMFYRVRLQLKLDGVLWPETEWFSLLSYCVDIYNMTPRRTLDYRTPTEVAFGHTPDRSGFWTPYWTEVAFADPRAPFPSDKWVIGRNIGLSHNHGNYLCSVIRTGKGKRLHRSAVATVAELRKGGRNPTFTSPDTIEELEDRHLNPLDHPLLADGEAPEPVQVPTLATGERQEEAEVDVEADSTNAAADAMKLAAAKTSNDDFELEEEEVNPSTLVGSSLVLVSPSTGKTDTADVISREENHNCITYKVRFSDGEIINMTRSDLEAGLEPSHFHFDKIIRHEVHASPRGSPKGDMLMLLVSWGEDRHGNKYPQTLELYNEFRENNEGAVADYFVSNMNLATAVRTGGVVHKAYVWSKTYSERSNALTFDHAHANVRTLKQHGLLDEGDFLRDFCNPFLAGKQMSTEQFNSAWGENHAGSDKVHSNMFPIPKPSAVESDTSTLPPNEASAAEGKFVPSL